MLRLLDMLLLPLSLLTSSAAAATRTNRLCLLCIRICCAGCHCTRPISRCNHHRRCWRQLVHRRCWRTAACPIIALAQRLLHTSRTANPHALHCANALGQGCHHVQHAAGCDLVLSSTQPSPSQKPLRCACVGRRASRAHAKHNNDAPSCCGVEIFSGGRCRSAMLAMEIPHLNVGAQKWTARRGRRTWTCVCLHGRVHGCVAWPMHADCLHRRWVAAFCRAYALLVFGPAGWFQNAANACAMLLNPPTGLNVRVVGIRLSDEHDAARRMPRTRLCCWRAPPVLGGQRDCVQSCVGLLMDFKLPLFLSLCKPCTGTLGGP